jgi:hypothetical protein
MAISESLGVSNSVELEQGTISYRERGSGRRSFSSMGCWSTPTSGAMSCRRWRTLAFAA